MKNMKLLQLLSCALAIAHRTRAYQLPFSTAGKDIVDQAGQKFVYMGTNWPGHMPLMIPEGLQYASVQDIVSWIKEFGLNSVRLTYAIQMVDEILDGSDQSLRSAALTALGDTAGEQVLQQILSHNAAFSENTTRLQVFDAVARELSTQGILLHLDNHVSRAAWCCGESDGNAWFGDTDFDVQRWIRGWEYMSKHAASYWPSFSSVGLRNELRAATGAEPYDWYTWYVHMTAAAEAVHQNAPDALIFFSGLGYDTDIGPIPLGLPLNGTDGTDTGSKSAVFVPDELPYAGKIVLELHKYDFEHTEDPCDKFIAKWYPKGLQAMNATDPSVKYLFPVVLSEWGFIQDGEYLNQTTYNRCLIETVEKYKMSWMQWDLAGSYYDKNDVLDVDETWGLLNHNWSAVRSQVTVEQSLKKLISAAML